MPFAADLDLEGRDVLVVGGSESTLSKITQLLNAGARVHVVADEVPTSVRDLAERNLITWTSRTFVASDLDAAALVLVAGGSAEQDQLVAEAARAENLPCILMDARDAQSGNARTGIGEVILVGGGPGDPGLLTVAGRDALRRADVVVCDRLAPLAALDQVSAGAEIIDVGKIPRGEFTSQQAINALLIKHAGDGSVVVRLKGGDNFVFGRGGEEWQACAEAGIPVTVIPGVSSAIAVPGLAGIPLTHRTLTQGFTVVSGHLPPGHPESTLDWSALAKSGTTLVILMGVAQLGTITAELIKHGLAPQTPAASIADGGLPSMRTVRGTVETISADTITAEIKPPAVTVIGAVAGFDPTA